MVASDDIRNRRRENQLKVRPVMKWKLRVAIVPNPLHGRWLEKQCMRVAAGGIHNRDDGVDELSCEKFLLMPCGNSQIGDRELATHVEKLSPGIFKVHLGTCVLQKDLCVEIPRAEKGPRVQQALACCLERKVLPLGGGSYRNSCMCNT